MSGALWWWSCQSPVAHSCGLLNHRSSLHRRMFKLNAKFNADSLLYSLSHFECDGHTVYLLTQQHLIPSLTSTVMSLFTHMHSSPLSLAARLRCCHTNHSYYINNGWTFSGQTLYIYWFCFSGEPWVIQQVCEGRDGDVCGLWCLMKGFTTVGLADQAPISILILLSTSSVTLIKSC